MLAYCNRAYSYYELKKYNQAAQDCDKAIELKPDFEDAYFVRYMSLMRLRDFKLALYDATKLIQLKPDDGLYYKMRGRCYQLVGDNAKAQADFARAKQLGYNG